MIVLLVIAAVVLVACMMIGSGDWDRPARGVDRAIVHEYVALWRIG